MTTDIRLFIDRVPLSVNRVLRMHWAKRRLYNEQFLNEIFLAKNRLKIFGRPEHSPVQLQITLYICGQSEMDADNAVAACKPIIDALVKVGILLDDDPETVTGVSVTQIRKPRREVGVAIEIELL